MKILRSSFSLLYSNYTLTILLTMLFSTLFLYSELHSMAYQKYSALGKIFSYQVKNSHMRQDILKIGKLLSR